ncbi:MAG: hypothetical protein J6S96_01200 [Muribaculaceae bacterium]|nr:hypothetical protein [Muribaculaceae bacterium]
MKKIVLLLVALLSFGIMRADDYLPMVREGLKWVYRLSYINTGDDELKVMFISYEFKDDVEINGITYKKCWRTIEDKSGTFDTIPTVIAYAREKDKKVYAIYDDAFVAQTRDYNAGYREFEVNPYFKIQNLYPGDIDLITINEYTYKDNNDEYLIYDFNDFSYFYSKYPSKSYNCGFVPGSYYDENNELQEIQENQDFIVTVGKRADPVGTVNVQGRNLMQYEVKTTLKAQIEDRTTSSRAAASESNTPSTVVELNDESLLAIEGYGIYNLGRGLTRIPKRNIAAFYCRSFMSPEAMMRHIDESIFDNIADAVYFCFCHIEENGEKVIQRELCDYYHDLFNNIGNQDVSIDDLTGEYIKCDGAYYDMQGRRVAEPAQPGIYVRDGKKIVVK